jgi:hypothetical protein
MNRLQILLVAVITACLTGCISHYRYESRGIVKNHAGEEQGALLYYEEDDGRLWYGRKYRMPDSDADLKVCKATDKSFVPTSESDPSLGLMSQGGDSKVAALSDAGAIAPLESPERLHPGETCGVVLVGGAPAGIEELDEGVKPWVAIFCENPRRPGRYPEAALYPFDALTRKKVKSDRTPSSPCVEGAGEGRAEE